VFTLAQLEQAIRDSWAADTADSDNEWSPENPSCGQCDITSLVVHDLLGGDLLGADVYVDDERVEAHMWNRLPTGIEVDLTASSSDAEKSSQSPSFDREPRQSPTRPIPGTTGTRSTSSCRNASARVWGCRTSPDASVEGSSAEPGGPMKRSVDCTTAAGLVPLRIERG
jgi:hypothetical protein